jgi:hypothetical protein
LSGLGISHPRIILLLFVFLAGGLFTMSSHKRLFVTVAVLFCCAFSAPAAEKKPKETKPEESKSSYELPQPATENLDRAVYQRIREEGLGHSHVMDYASGLMDGIGPRLTGSPILKRANEWTRDQLRAWDAAMLIWKTGASLAWAGGS